MHLYQSLAEFTLPHITVIATFGITVCISGFFLHLDSEPRCFPPQESSSHNVSGKASHEGCREGGSRGCFGVVNGEFGGSFHLTAAIRGLRGRGRGAARAGGGKAEGRNCGKYQPISGGVAARPLLPAAGEPRGSRFPALGGPLRRVPGLGEKRPDP